MKKFVCVILLLFTLFSPALPDLYCRAEEDYFIENDFTGAIEQADDGITYENYKIYNDDGEVVCERSNADVGDRFITDDFCEYEIYEVENHEGKARKIGQLEKPKISSRKNIKNEKMSQRGKLSKKICLYMTHNDESYLPSDGYDSIYGAGGIHDVTRRFQQLLEEQGINVVLDETLHIPHDSSAYSRSYVTANKLLNEERPDAMFDCHRDGVSKSYYYVNNGYEAFSKIRIVVGKSNPNFDQNYCFAQSLFALGNSIYPNLFSDIYIGKGHYNQSLQPSDLLFEMGTYLIEKEYVYNSLPKLASVIDTLLYASEVDQEGNITIDEQNDPNNNIETVTPSNDNESKVVNVAKSSKGWIAAMIMSLFLILLLIVAAILLKKRDAKNRK